MSICAPRPELAGVIADWRGEAAILRRRGDERFARILEQCAEEAADVADEFTQWISEAEAARRAGWTGDQVRRHARKYMHTSHVTYEKRKYRLRACIVPRRGHPEMMREAARMGAA